jgi:hypothetical protein
MAEPGPEPRIFRQLYWLVIAVLAVEIMVFWAITRAYS